MRLLRKLFSIIIAFTVFISCKDENEPILKKEMFNSEYSIMFPRTYKGGSEQVTSVSTFFISRNDDKVLIYGGFCIHAYPTCFPSDYSGESFENIPDSVKFTNMRGQIAYMNKRMIIYDNQDILGCFYFTNSVGDSFRDFIGRIYLRTCNSNCYLWAGRVYFASSEQQEVEEIIKTLKPK